jgi:hypothetical protein
LKYFTYELFQALNDERLDEEKMQGIERKWENNCRLYWDNFRSLSKRIPTEIYNKFSFRGFHDDRLENIKVEHTSLFHMNIHLFITGEKESWQLTFCDIRSLTYNHLNKGPVPIFHPKCDDWAYEEFLPIDDKTLSFEVLCSSGANIKIIYEDDNISMQRLI